MSPVGEDIAICLWPTTPLPIHHSSCGQRPEAVQSPDPRSNGEAWPMGESPPEAPRTLSRSEVLGMLMPEAGCERSATQWSLSDPDAPVRHA